MSERYINKLAIRSSLLEDVRTLEEWLGLSRGGPVIGSIREVLEIDSPFYVAAKAPKLVFENAGVTWNGTLPDKNADLSSFEEVTDSWLSGVGTYSSNSTIQELKDDIAFGNFQGTHSDFQTETGTSPSNASIIEILDWNSQFATSA